MENFIKINSLVKELFEELSTLKNDLANNINYSSDHAEIIAQVEDVEDNISEIEIQLQDIDRDIDTLNEKSESRENELDYDNEEKDEDNELIGFHEVDDNY